MIAHVVDPKIIDISPLVSVDTAVFPGDTPLSQKTLCDFKTGQSFKLSTITSTVHLGAHADAPSHYHAEGEDISERNLAMYYGKAQVIEIKKPRGMPIQIEDLADKPILAPRILFKTLSYPQPDHWNSDFNSLSPELIEHLHLKGVFLVGIDTPSIDLAGEKILKTHHQVYQRNFAILEGLVLDHVAEGLYTLCALPLKLRNFEASPVRAVLLDTYKDSST